MKKIFTILIFCNLISIAFSQVVEKTVTAGSLKASFNEEEKQCSSLKVNGTIDVTDFVFMRDELPNLENLDLSNVNIQSYNSPYTPNENGCFFSSYAANEIPGYCFANWYSGIGKSTLKIVKLPISITSIGINAFSACVNLTNIEFPSNLVVIHSTAFQGCVALTSVIFPEGLEDTGDYVFSRCYNLTNVQLPNSLLYIGKRIFSECYQLKTITIPENVIQIGDGAFGYCANLTDIYSNPVTPVILSATANIFQGVDKNTCVLHVPDASYAAYRNATEWKDFKNINNKIITKVDDYNSDTDIKIIKFSSHIEIKTDRKIQNVSLFDLSGKRIFNSNSGEKHLSLLSVKNGVYIISIQLDNRDFSFKIIK